MKGFMLIEVLLLISLVLGGYLFMSHMLSGMSKYRSEVVNMAAAVVSTGDSGTSTVFGVSVDTKVDTAYLSGARAHVINDSLLYRFPDLDEATDMRKTGCDHMYWKGMDRRYSMSVFNMKSSIFAFPYLYVGKMLTETSTVDFYTYVMADTYRLQEVLPRRSFGYGVYDMVYRNNQLFVLYKDVDMMLSINTVDDMGGLTEYAVTPVGESTTYARMSVTDSGIVIAGWNDTSIGYITYSSYHRQGSFSWITTTVPAVVQDILLAENKVYVLTQDAPQLHVFSTPTLSLIHTVIYPHAVWKPKRLAYTDGVIAIAFPDSGFYRATVPEIQFLDPDTLEQVYRSDTVGSILDFSVSGSSTVSNMGGTSAGLYTGTSTLEQFDTLVIDRFHCFGNILITIEGHIIRIYEMGEM